MLLIKKLEVYDGLEGAGTFFAGELNPKAFTEHDADVTKSVIKKLMTIKNLNISDGSFVAIRMEDAMILAHYITKAHETIDFLNRVNIDNQLHKIIQE